MSQPLQIRRNPALGPDEHRRLSEFYAERVTGWDTKDREAFEALVAAMPLRGRQLVAPPLAGGADWPVLIRWGRELPFNNLVVRRMSANECHQNSAELWADSMARTDEGVGSTLRIETGFALSDDGLWREHTWVRDMSGGGEGTLIETTQARVAYWGIALTQQGSWVFAAEQLGYAPVPETADDRTRESLEQAATLIELMFGSGADTPLLAAEQEDGNRFIAV